MITAETLPTRYEAGTASVTAGQTTVTQTDAAWFGNVWGDDLFFLPSQPLVPPQRVAQANEDGTLTLAYPWPGANAANVAYEVRYVGMIERSTAQSRRVLEQLGEVSAYYDVQVNALADRAAFDNRPAGYRVLVSNIGDGRAAIYSKLTSNTADWSSAAILGEIGPAGPVGPVGITWKGSWDSSTAYAARDGVLFNGSSWRAKQANSNQAPPALPAIENAYWHLVAQRGTDGTGTGDVVGPNSSVSGRIALFSGTTGKLLQQAGLALSDLQPAGSYEPARAKATQADAEGGTGTAVLGWAPQQIVQAILARAPSTSDLEFTVSQLALGLADANNVAQFLGPSGNRIADSFDALTYVDVAGATNLDTSVTGLLKPSASGLVRVSDGVAGNPIGNAATVANINDNNTGTTSTWTGQDLNGQSVANRRLWQIDLGSVRQVKRVEAKQLRQSTTSGTSDNGFYTSEDGINWTLYGATSGFSSSPIDYVQNVTRSARYVAFVATATGWSGLNWILADLNVYLDGPLNNLTVRSAAFTASQAPAKMKALINVREVDTATAGVDYTLECSRDAGTTWATMSLTKRYVMPNGLAVVEASETSVAGQPSGTAPRWRFKTQNNKNVELHDVYLYWS